MGIRNRSCGLATSVLCAVFIMCIFIAEGRTRVYLRWSLRLSSRKWFMHLFAGEAGVVSSSWVVVVRSVSRLLWQQLVSNSCGSLPDKPLNSSVGQLETSHAHGQYC